MSERVVLTRLTNRIEARPAMKPEITAAEMNRGRSRRRALMPALRAAITSRERCSLATEKSPAMSVMKGATDMYRKGRCSR